MEITNKVRKLIYGMFDRMIEGSDKYITDNSMWLIFTEEKRWIIEFTNKKTLWFNYNIFQSEFNLLSMDCVKSKDIIKEWFESRFLGIDVVEDTLSTAGKPQKVEDTIQNGVKDTKSMLSDYTTIVEDTIQNGVKDTKELVGNASLLVEDTIQNGVKKVSSDEGYMNHFKQIYRAEQTIQNGIKE